MKFPGKGRISHVFITVIITLTLCLSSGIVQSIGMNGKARSEEARYDPSSGQLDVVVDYGTYIGGGSLDEIIDVAVGPDGYIFFTGRTTSYDFPTTESGVNQSNNGWNDVFVCKFSPDGRRLIYSTYFGGTEGDSPSGIAVDAAGCAFVVGTTYSPDFPTTPGCLQESFGNRTDAFVFKLSPDGDRVEFSTFLGGEYNDGAMDVVYDERNNVCIVVGYTQSSDFPTSRYAYDTEVNGWDVFVSGLSADGTLLQYSTLIGLQGQDRAHSVSLDSSGNIIVSGFSSGDFPITSGAYQQTHAGANDGIIAVLDPQASQLLRSTYLGGSMNEVCERVAVLPNGDIAVLGTTGSGNLPTSQDAFDGSFGGGNTDDYLSILDRNLTSLEYSTYLGGPLDEYMGGLVTDGSGTVYVSGSSASPSFPTTGNALQDRTNGGEDFIIFVLATSTNTPLLSTFCGGGSTDRSNCMAVDGNGSLIVPGFSTSYDFPVTDDAFQPSHDIHWDGAFVIIPDPVPPVANAGEDVLIDQHDTVELNGSGSYDNVQIADWTWLLDNGSGPVTLNGISQECTFHEAGRFIVTLNVSDAVGNWCLDRINITVRDVTPPMARIDCPDTVDQDELVPIDGTGSTDNVGIASWAWTIEEYDGPIQLSGQTIEHRFPEVGTYRITLNVTDGEGNWATRHRNITVVDITSPVADAGDDIEVDQHVMVTLDGRGSMDNVDIVNWSWSIPQDDVSRTVYGPTIDINFDEPGSYIVVLVVRDAMGNEGTDTVSISVVDITPPIADAGQDVLIDQHEVVLFDAGDSSDNVGITGWEWELFYDGTSHTSQEQSFEFNFDLAGDYTVQLTVTDEAGNSADDTVNVTVADTTPPEAVIGPPIYVDQHEEFDLDGELSEDNVGIANFTWRLFVVDGPDVVKYGEHVSYSIAVVGDHEIRLAVIDAAGNIDIETLAVHVRDITPPTAVIDVDKNRTKVGNIIVFDGSASEDNVGVVNWTWTFIYKGEQVLLDKTFSQFLFERPGEYEVTLTVRDAAGNENSSSIWVTVDEEVQPSSSSWPYIAIVLLVLAGVVVALVAARKHHN